MLNKAKCHFNVPEIVVLGHTISVSEIRADLSKTEAITKFEIMLTKKSCVGSLV